jgi:hypothetical protein
MAGTPSIGQGLCVARSNRKRLEPDVTTSPHRRPQEDGWTSQRSPFEPPNRGGRNQDELHTNDHPYDSIEPLGP